MGDSVRSRVHMPVCVCVQVTCSHMHVLFVHSFQISVQCLLHFKRPVGRRKKPGARQSVFVPWNSHRPLYVCAGGHAVPVPAPKPNFLLPAQDFSQDSCYFVTIPGIILLGGLNL